MPGEQIALREIAYRAGVKFFFAQRPETLPLVHPEIPERANWHCELGFRSRPSSILRGSRYRRGSRSMSHTPKTTGQKPYRQPPSIPARSVGISGVPYLGTETTVFARRGKGLGRRGGLRPWACSHECGERNGLEFRRQRTYRHLGSAFEIPGRPIFANSWR
jgi:hypothetical protein